MTPDEIRHEVDILAKNLGEVWGVLVMVPRLVVARNDLYGYKMEEWFAAKGPSAMQPKKKYLTGKRYKSVR